MNLTDPREMSAARSLPPTVAPVAWAPLLAVGGLLFATLVAFAGRYGYHRDELYFLAAGRHLDWGYVDQPPLTPMLARLVEELAPGSLLALRLPSAIAAAAVAVLGGLIARELGGGRAAQVLAAAASSVSAYSLFMGHILSTGTLDLLAWAAVGWLLARLLRTGDMRLWLAIGAVGGVGMLNKSLVAFLGLAVALAMLASAREMLKNRYVVAGAAIAVTLALPNLLWQAMNGWPQLEMASAITADEPLGGRALLLPFQLVIASPLLVPLWVVGLIGLLRHTRPVNFRPLGWTYLMLLGIFMVLGGQPYYPAGWYPVLISAGSVATVAWLRRAVGRQVVLRSAAAGTALALAAATSAVIALPVLPRSVLAESPVGDVNEAALETVGWPEFVARVEAAWQERDDRASAVILTGNYGEAGALELLGSIDLPVYSGHNSYWHWARPPEDTRAALVVGLSEERLAPVFQSCEQVARTTNSAEVENEEHGGAILWCEAPTQPWDITWPQLRHYN